MRNKKNAILISIIVVFALIFAGAVGYLIYGMINNQSSEDEYKSIASSFARGVTDDGATYSPDNPEGYTGNLENKSGTTSPEQVDQTVSVKVNNVDTPVSFDELKAQNSDIYAWIYIPDTNINYPVLQNSEDDNFYLRGNLHPVVQQKGLDRQGNGAVRSQYGKRSNVCQSSYVCRFKLL